ncbi:redox-regulated ATPase YchF [Candidatus Peregrinibacteria bacterium]|nr:redox-regulated ATPase YchF [Candidatus Peregrinibacteria bacterium]
MSLKIGILGLPNVGKSTLFNALTRTKSAEAKNYPFCTIEPNMGIVEVPDQRLKSLSEVSMSEKVIPTTIEFVDIAGLVEGAHKGEGLGNKFLSHVRECDAIGHVVRFFEAPNVTHVHDCLDPKIDREIIESELLLADIQTMEKRLEKAKTDAKSGEKEKKNYAELLERVNEGLRAEILASNMEMTNEETEILKDLNLLTMKPHLYIVNVHEDELGNIDMQKFADILKVENKDKIIPICAKVEEELGDFNEEEASEYLKSLGLEKTGLNALIISAYNALDLITFFTSGPKETRAWTVNKGHTAPKAAGKIHTDFEKGFIKAEVVDWENFVKSGGEIKSKEEGLIRLEGKEYQVKDGDVMHFKFST